MMNSRRGFATIWIILIVILIILAGYIVLLIPIPAFTEVREIINYYFSLLLFLLVQALLILTYYKLFVYGKKGIYILKNKIIKGTRNLKVYFLSGFD